METKTEKGFFGFVVDAQKDTALLEEFLKTKTRADLKRFFGKYYIYKIDEQECNSIWAARKALCKETSPRELYDIVCGGRGY